MQQGHVIEATIEGVKVFHTLLDWDRSPAALGERGGLLCVTQKVLQREPSILRDYWTGRKGLSYPNVNQFFQLAGLPTVGANAHLSKVNLYALRQFFRKANKMMGISTTEMKMNQMWITHIYRGIHFRMILPATGCPFIKI